MKILRMKLKELRHSVLLDSPNTLWRYIAMVGSKIASFTSSIWSVATDPLRQSRAKFVESSRRLCPVRRYDNRQYFILKL